MSAISRTMRGLFLGALSGLLLASSATAALVRIEPTSQTIAAVGGTASVDIYVDGLTQALGGFGFQIKFDNSILTGLSFSANPDNKMGVNPDDQSLGFSVGPDLVDFFYAAGLASDASNSEANLALAQGSSFRLGTITFTGIAGGFSDLTFVNGLTYLSNFTGGATLQDVSVQNGSICVGANCGTVQVPEPGSMLLVATALGALVLRRRQTA